MFWILTGFAGLMAFAVTLGQVSVWFTLMKVALAAAIGVIAILSAMLLTKRSKEA
jgi:hypothetical protein